MPPAGPDPEPPGEPGQVAGEVVRVRDATTLRALAHPLRLKLLGLLRIGGPSTATLLGRRLGESSGATSYHLRELARYGFVTEVPGRGTGRERWWQAAHRMTSWDVADFAEGGSQVADELLRYGVRLRGRVLQSWLGSREELDRSWDCAASLNDYALRLTPQQARELAAELTAVADRWLATHPAAAPADAGELVALFVDAVPLRDWPVEA